MYAYYIYTWNKFAKLAIGTKIGPYVDIIVELVMPHIQRAVHVLIIYDGYIIYYSPRELVEGYYTLLQYDSIVVILNSAIFFPHD